MELVCFCLFCTTQLIRASLLYRSMAELAGESRGETVVQIVAAIRHQVA